MFFFFSISNTITQFISNSISYPQSNFFLGKIKKFIESLNDAILTIN